LDSVTSLAMSFGSSDRTDERLRIDGGDRDRDGEQNQPGEPARDAENP